MLIQKFIYLLIFLGWVNHVLADQVIEVRSPDGNIQLGVVHSSDGGIAYRLSYKGKQVVGLSRLGMKFKVPEEELTKFLLSRVDSTLIDETWKPVWGETSTIRNNYRQLVLRLINQGGFSKLVVYVTFRVFNDGIGFRYSFPQQSNFNHFILSDELTQFALAADHKAFWIPGDYDTNEFSYNTSKLSEVDASSSDMSQEIHAKTFFDKNAVQTPLMLKTADGLYINLHEAALVNYPAMNLVIDKTNFTLQSHLVPDAVGNKAYLQAPATTPWRTIVVSDKAGDILTSKLILNLNEPSSLKDVSWIKPQKFVGVWWEMHVGKASWDYGTYKGQDLIPHGRHGASSANVKRYIDFAAQHGFDGVLVEGWNTGWEDWFGQWKEDVFDFVTPYPDFNVEELNAYARSKGVKIIMHHETSGSVTNYERWMDTAYRFMKRYGYNSVKTGYVGKIIPRGEHHDGQWMVKHYERVARKTGDYKIMVDMHESVRLTGLHRTYPNWIASEAARGNEFNAWSVGNPPEHETILPFTRLMGGPMDYTPGIFKIKMSHYDLAKKEQVHTTLAKQLALYVTMYSPLQMAADLPENYSPYMDAFQFIKDVPVDWDDTRVPDAEPGDYIIMVRKSKGKPNWYLGAITDEQARNKNAPLNFLDAGKMYIATIYRDADNADWKTNPEAYMIEKFIVDNKTIIRLKLAAGGGTAISLVPASSEEIKSLKKYN